MFHFSLCCSFIHFLSNIVFHHTEPASIIPIWPVLPLTQNTLLPQSQNMHNYKDPIPPTPSTTNKEKSIIPLKQCNCKRTTHSSTYLSYGTESKCTTRTFISQQPVRPILFQYCHFRKHNEFAIKRLKKREVYITVVYIILAYFKCIYRKEHTWEVCQ